MFHKYVEQSNFILIIIIGISYGIAFSGECKPYHA